MKQPDDLDQFVARKCAADPVFKREYEKSAAEFERADARLTQPLPLLWKRSEEVKHDA